MTKMNLFFEDMKSFIDKPNEQFKAAIWNGSNWREIRDLTDGKCDFRYIGSDLSAYLESDNGNYFFVPNNWWVIKDHGKLYCCDIKEAKEKYPQHFNKNLEYQSYTKIHHMTIVQWNGENIDEVQKVGGDQIIFGSDGFLYLNSFRFPVDGINFDEIIPVGAYVINNNGEVSFDFEQTI